MKLISTIENYLIEGLWLPLVEEIEVIESDVDKYLALPGVKVVEAVEEIKQVETVVENKVEIELPIEENIL